MTPSIRGDVVLVVEMVWSEIHRPAGHSGNECQFFSMAAAPVPREMTSQTQRKLMIDDSVP
jgi:hypothetical protein